MSFHGNLLRIDIDSQGRRGNYAIPPANCDTTGLEMPVYEYLHPLGRSITGGYVYRGTELPSLEGAYVYGDYITGYIWALWYLDGAVKAN